MCAGALAFVKTMFYCVNVCELVESMVLREDGVLVYVNVLGVIMVWRAVVSSEVYVYGAMHNVRVSGSVDCV